MGFDVGQVEKERLRAVAADELDGLVREDVGAVAFHRNRFAAAPQILGEMFPGVTRIEISERRIEASIERVSERSIGESAAMPLADQRRGVALRLDGFRDG